MQLLDKKSYYRSLNTPPQRESSTKYYNKESARKPATLVSMETMLRRVSRETTPTTEIVSNRFPTRKIEGKQQSGGKTIFREVYAGGEAYIDISQNADGISHLISIGVKISIILVYWRERKGIISDA